MSDGNVWAENVRMGNVLSCVMLGWIVSVMHWNLVLWASGIGCNIFCASQSKCDEKGVKCWKKLYSKDITNLLILQNAQLICITKEWFVGHIHWDEVVYISLIDFQWTSSGTKSYQYLLIHHSIMITCISYGKTFAILVPKCINIAPF